MSLDNDNSWAMDYGSDNGTEVVHIDEKWVTSGVLTCLVGLIGLCGNALSGFVFLQPRLNSSFSQLLTAVAVWDSILILQKILSPHPSFSLIEWLGLQGTSHQGFFIPIANFILVPIGSIAQMASAYLFAAAHLERYFAVCQFNSARNAMCTLPRVKWVILAVSVGAVLVNMPRWFEVSLVPVLSQESPEIVEKYTGELWLLGNHSYSNYWSWGSPIVVLFIPWFVVFCLNVGIDRGLQRNRISGEVRGDVGGKDSSELMLLYVSLLFLVFSAFDLLLYYGKVIQIYGCAAVGAVWPIRRLVIVVSSSIKFFIYASFDHFRDELPSLCQSMCFCDSHDSIDDAEVEESML